MKCGILSMLAIAALAFAQEPKPKAAVQPEPESKVFVLKHADAQDVGNILAQVLGGKNISSNREMKVIAVSGTPAMIEGVAEALAKLDVPPQPVKNIEITGYLLVGSTKAEAGGSVPAELESVAKQIRATFPYKAFQVMDTLVVRTQPGPAGRHAEVSGVLAPSDGDVLNTSYEFKISSPAISGEGKDTIIHLGGLNLTMRVPVRVSNNASQMQSAGISTDVDLREGQKIVVGKSSFGSPDKALFLVLTAKVME